ncbi:MAG: serine/threonine-protein kinase [Myxococcota bacterium]|nr:serine/threonine-protein kinase [Myxococcota bacterium]
MSDTLPKNVPVSLSPNRGFPRPFGRYILEKSLSRGGMGEIFLAVPRGVKARCVIKTIRSDLTGEKEFVGRFADEAKIMMRIVHKNIIRIFDCGKVGKNYYIAMEYSYGRDLGDVLDRAYERAEPMPPGIGLFLTEKMLEGLHFIHNATAKDGRPMRLVHRDISPQNVLVGFDGSVKLIDFGLARTELLPGRTQGQLAVGKYGYMSPEQARHDKIDGRADIYSLGVMLFEVFTSDRLVDEQDQATLWSRVLNPKHRNPRSVLPKLSKEIDDLVMNAVAPKPEHRFQSADSMLKFVRSMRTQPVSAEEIKKYMRYLYPRVDPNPPALPDLSSTGESSEYSMIIAMSEEGAKSVFGRGKLPVEFTQQVHIDDILPELERRKREKKENVETEERTVPTELKIPGKKPSVNQRVRFSDSEDQPTMIHEANPRKGLEDTYRENDAAIPHVVELNVNSGHKVSFPEITPEKYREEEATVMMEAPPSPGISPFSNEVRPVTFGNSDIAEVETRVEEPVAVVASKPKVGRRMIKEKVSIPNEISQSVTMRKTIGQKAHDANQLIHDRHRAETSDQPEHHESGYSDIDSPNWMMGGLIMLGLTIIIILLAYLLRG